MRITLSAAAHEFLRRETAYLRSRDIGAATRFVAEMRSATRRLATYDRIGRPDHELPVPGLRRIVVRDYVVLYDVASDEIRVLAVRHGRQAPFDCPIDADHDYESDLD